MKRKFSTLNPIEIDSGSDKVEASNEQQWSNILRPMKKKSVREELISIRSFPCRRPAFKDQRVYSRAGMYILDDHQNSVAVEYNFFPEDVLSRYLTEAVNVARVSGRSAFNSVKPRKEVCYTVDGQPFRYSRILHPTTKYPPHVIRLLPYFQQYIEKVYPHTIYRKISGALDILYSPEFERGGSAGAHSDDEMDWGLVIIFSLGQTRWFRIKHKENQSTYHNFEMKHNSVIIMHGKTFQEQYTHQVDKLGNGEQVYYRLSLNIRYLEGENNLAELIANA